MRPTVVTALVLVVGVAVGPAVARADKDIVIESPGERTTQNELVIGGIAVAGLAIGAIGLHYNLDARDASNAVTQTLPTGRTWTAGDQALVDQASSSSTKAEVFYAIGGAAVVGAIVAFIVTAPPSTTTVIHSHPAEHARAIVTPARGGGTVGAAWSF